MDTEIKFETLDSLILYFIKVKGRNSFLTIQEIIDLSHKHGEFECTVDSVRAKIIELAELRDLFTATKYGLIDSIGI
ncbi:hypothetical protein JI723_06875 [Providencia manganoxydans]|uniref:Uncharacterized protein n=1 Tax=Providencia manganoxydans TaxID=2923283 RepID=A0ABX7AK67_9GAMM|nr:MULTISPECIES: hypothetical protein [unclassified Providencia]ELR5288127.1 hypothetical protein [Providencia rettgeri]QQO63689.1 hypothetical protein JI723_06875 [Providencia manganoxydans]